MASRFALAGLILGTVPLGAQRQVLDGLHEMLPAFQEDTRVVLLEDLDEDGDPDALIGFVRRNGMGRRLYVNRGDGQFCEAPERLPAELGLGSSVYCAAAEDLDGDGSTDLMLGNLVGATVLLQGADGVFVDASDGLPDTIEKPTAIALGDVDADGDFDAVILNRLDVHGSGTGQNELYRNNGDGSFEVDPAALPVEVMDSYDGTLVDVDGDADLDLLVANIPSSLGGTPGVNQLYLNEGSGIFAAAPFPLDDERSMGLACGDLDGDGDPDVVIANYASLADLGVQNRLYLNDGGGGFIDATDRLPIELDHTEDVEIADFDADGDLDLLFVNALDPSRVLLNDGSAIFAVGSASLPLDQDTTVTGTAADVDGDGDVDILLGNSIRSLTLGRPDRLHLNSGDADFFDVSSALPIPGAVTTSVALGDIDGDQDLDVLKATTDLGEQLLLNDGTGFFTDVSSRLPAISSVPFAHALGDVDGDGDLDVYGAVQMFSDLLYTNDGAGTFSDASDRLPRDTAWSNGVLLFDAESDGDLDAYVHTGFVFAPQQDRLSLNDGSGTFVDASPQIPLDFDVALTAAAADVDADGDLDVAIGASGRVTVKLRLNDGSGGYVDATDQLPAATVFSTMLVFGDVDGDGDEDLLLGDQFENHLFTNDGGGVFADASTQLPPSDESTLAVALDDFDADGDLDAFFGNLEESRLLLNDGAGAFADDGAADGKFGEVGALAVGNLDGDADIDIYLGGFNGFNVPAYDRVLSNTTRQLAWSGLPRVGKDLVLDVFGPASTPWILACSPGSSDIAVPPFGTLRLDPQGLVVIGVGILDDAGQGRLVCPIGDDPSLIGATFFNQGAAGSPLRLTNLERTTLLGL